MNDNLPCEPYVFRAGPLPGQPLELCYGVEGPGMEPYRNLRFRSSAEARAKVRELMNAKEPE